MSSQRMFRLRNEKINHFFITLSYLGVGGGAVSRTLVVTRHNLLFFRNCNQRFQGGQLSRLAPEK